MLLGGEIIPTTFYQDNDGYNNIKASFKGNDIYYIRIVHEDRYINDFICYIYDDMPSILNHYTIKLNDNSIHVYQNVITLIDNVIYILAEGTGAELTTPTNTFIIKLNVL